MMKASAAEQRPRPRLTRGVTALAVLALAATTVIGLSGPSGAEPYEDGAKPWAGSRGPRAWP